MQDREVTEYSQHGLTRGESCLTNLVVLYERMTALVKKGRAMDFTYLDLCTAFDTIAPEHPSP